MKLLFLRESVIKFALTPSNVTGPHHVIKGRHRVLTTTIPGRSWQEMRMCTVEEFSIRSVDDVLCLNPTGSGRLLEAY